MNLRKNFPTLWVIYSLLREGSPTFSGWGMTTTSTYPPWLDKNSNSCPAVVKGFNSAHEEIIKRVSKNKFLLSQIPGNIEKQIQLLESLKWRHYLVYWSARLAAQQSLKKETNFVECGVCDGLSLFFATQAGKQVKKNLKVFAYDAWAPMKSRDLQREEKKLSGAYGHISLDNTKRNLQKMSSRVVWNRGSIPTSFRFSKNPDSVAWLHLDLNSALATEKSLQFFFSRFCQGTIVLFDDYGWKAHLETKKKVDRFVRHAGMELLHFPTGQAIAFFPQRNESSRK